MTTAEEQVTCQHEFYEGVCIHCQATDPSGSKTTTVPDDIPLRPKKPAQQSSDVPPHIQAEMMREQQALKARTSLNIKEAKPINIEVPINRFSVGWTTDGNKIVLRDDVYNNNEVVIDFQGASKKLDKKGKVGVLNDILSNLEVDDD